MIAKMPLGSTGARRQVHYDTVGNARKADLAAIHMGAQALQWTREEYEDIMATVCSGIRSAALLDHTGRKRFLAHIRACAGAVRVQARRNPDNAPATPKKPALTGPQRLMWSLWMRLVDAGLAETRSMKALNAFCERQTQVQRIEWLNQKQQDLVIVSLKEWLKRGPNGPQS